MANLIEHRVEAARRGENPLVVVKLPSGWLCIGDTQPLRGYCVLLADPIVPSLNALSEPDRIRYALDVIRAGDALLAVTGAVRINYETLANAEPSLHTHIIPRYADEPEDKRRLPPMLAYDWAGSPAFDAASDGELVSSLKRWLSDPSERGLPARSCVVEDAGWEPSLRSRNLSNFTPAEWSPHREMWVGFPSADDLWLEDLAPAQAEVAALARALAGPGCELVKLMVAGEAALAVARERLGDVAGIEIVPGAFGDIWLRDTAPIFATCDTAAAFRFNGWGGKYELPGDEAVAEQIAGHTGATLTRHDFVLEGGAIDHDGAGTVLTTRQCLLNPNRNRGWREGHAERALAESLGARRVLWLDQGLMNDHTDGHVDNLARFVAPGVVACPMGFGEDDPNTAIYDKAAEALAGFSDADGRRLKVVRIPTPGRIKDDDHHVVPASHMNFLIANGAVILPTYEDVASNFAVQALEALFPDRAVIALPSSALLTGGGSFHCISQQVPA